MKKKASVKDFGERMIKKFGFWCCLAIVLVLIVTFLTENTATSSNTGKDLPIYCVDTEEKKIALSFDGAWGNEDTQTLLDILKKHDVKVTFFMTGQWVENFPEDVKKIIEAGHDMGNHSENHKQMSQLSAEECKEEIMKVHDKVKELTGYEMTLFRPPYGDYNNTVVQATKDCGYHCVQWDVDTLYIKVMTF